MEVCCPQEPTCGQLGGKMGPLDGSALQDSIECLVLSLLGERSIDGGSGGNSSKSLPEASDHFNIFTQNDVQCL